MARPSWSDSRGTSALSMTNSRTPAVASVGSHSCGQLASRAGRRAAGSWLEGRLTVKQQSQVLVVRAVVAWSGRVAANEHPSRDKPVARDGRPRHRSHLAADAVRIGQLPVGRGCGQPGAARQRAPPREGSRRGPSRDDRWASAAPQQPGRAGGHPPGESEHGRLPLTRSSWRAGRRQHGAVTAAGSGIAIAISWDRCANHGKCPMQIAPAIDDWIDRETAAGGTLTQRRALAPSRALNVRTRPPGKPHGKFATAGM